MKQVVGYLAAAMMLFGCASPHSKIDRTPVPLEAVVTSQSDEPWQFSHGRDLFYDVELRLVDSDDPSVTRLLVWTNVPLPPGHPLREIGATVIFATQKALLTKNATHFASNPTPEYYYYHLPLEALTGLRKKRPPQAPEPTAPRKAEPEAPAKSRDDPH